MKFMCVVCGYVYNPEMGEPETGIEPGTAFQDLPKNWVCPVCAVGKVMFRELQDLPEDD